MPRKKKEETTSKISEETEKIEEKLKEEELDETPKEAPKKTKKERMLEGALKQETAKKEEKKKISQQEFEEKIIELAAKGMTAEKIGSYLKRQGIHAKDYSKKISEILKEKNNYTVPELKNVSEKLAKLREHCAKNKNDKRAKREVDRIFQQLRKLKLYHE